MQVTVEYRIITATIKLPSSAQLSVCDIWSIHIIFLYF